MEIRSTAGLGNSRTVVHAWVARFLAGAVLALVAACGTSGSRQVTHQFIFDGWFDRWAGKVDLLAYSYGDSERMVSNKVRADQTTLGYRSNVNGPMRVGEFLHVTWRVKSTGQVHDRRIDLRPLLPRDMSQHALTFVIDDDQLYVYLVTPQAKKVDAPPLLRTTESRYRVTYEIYPTNTYQNR